MKRSPQESQHEKIASRPAMTNLELSSRAQWNEAWRSLAFQGSYHYIL
jgi:hypothetical protein